MEEVLMALKKNSKAKKAAAIKIKPLAPAVDTINVNLTTEELSTLANLMGVTAKVYENLAMQAAKDNDDSSFAILSARYKLSSMYANKLGDFCKIPEPYSRDLH